MRVWLLALAACAAGAMTISAQDDAAKAKAVVEKAIKAAGWSETKNMSWKDKGAFSIMDQKLDYTADWAVALPDKYRFDFKSKFGDMPFTITAALNGDTAWESAMGMTRDVTGEKLGYMKHEAYKFWVSSLTPLVTDKDFQLKSVADKDVNGKPAAGVEVNRKDRPAVTLYFDKETGLPAKSESKIKDEFQDWKEVLGESYVGGWKDLDKRKVFTTLKIVRDGKTFIESELSDSKLPEKFDVKFFEKPEGK